MSDNVGAQRTTRRAFFSLLGLTAAAGVATAATILTIGDADAQTRGMERRDNRRDDRQKGLHSVVDGASWELAVRPSR